MQGQVFGHYRVLERIGAGGMGVVWRARDERLERDVAVKVLPVETLADESAQERFRKEALALSRLNHPNVCTIHDWGEDGGRAYLVMERVEGRPLASLIRRGGLPPDTVVQYGRQIAAALRHAHEHGILHRDLKSANVMVTPGGLCKVLDFGLAKRFDDPVPAGSDGSREITAVHDMLTQAGAFVGTVHYMAPEILQGEPASVVSDVWSLGVLLHEMAAGALPFDGDTSYELIAAIQNRAPRPLPERVPQGVRAIIYRCLAKEPAQRYHSVGEVGAALEAAALEVVGSSWPSGTRVRTASRWGAVIAGVLVLVAAAALLARPSWLGGGRATPISSVAVLPLESRPADPAQEYFADGVTEELITELSKVGSLRVISRTSAMHYKGTSKALPVIARELGVDAILEGSVNRSADRIRVTVNLVRAATDQSLWAQHYDRDLRDVLELQQEVAGTVIRQLNLVLAPDEASRLAGARKVDPEVYRLYLQGRFHLSVRTEGRLKLAIERFEEAIEKDPSYAPAYAALARALTNMRFYVSPRSIMDRARSAALEAIRLDEGLAEAHVALGKVLLFYDWDASGAERELRRAIELSPGSALAHSQYSSFLTAMGRSEEALAETRRALELDPLSLAVQFCAMWVKFVAGRYDEVIVQADRALEIEPGFTWGALLRGLALMEKGLIDQGRDTLREAVGMERSPLTLGFLAMGDAMAGHHDEALHSIHEMEEIGKQRYVCAYEIGTAYAVLGDRDRAFGYLRKAVDDRADCLAWLEVEPWMKPLQLDPRYQEIRERVGLRRR